MFLSFFFFSSIYLCFFLSFFIQSPVAQTTLRHIVDGLPAQLHSSTNDVGDVKSIIRRILLHFRAEIDTFVGEVLESTDVATIFGGGDVTTLLPQLERTAIHKLIVEILKDTR
jgi:hypothetical protein